MQILYFNIPLPSQYIENERSQNTPLLFQSVPCTETRVMSLVFCLITRIYTEQDFEEQELRLVEQAYVYINTLFFTKFFSY